MSAPSPATLTANGAWPECCTRRELRRRVERLAAERDRLTPGTQPHDLAEAQLEQAQERLHRTFGGAQ